MAMRRWLPLLLLSLAAGLAGADDWSLRRDDPQRQIRVYLRDRADSPYHEVYAVTRIRATVAQVESVLADFPALTEWAPHVASVRLLRRQGSQAWIHVRYHLPYPFKPRDVVLHSRRSLLPGEVVNIHSLAEPGQLPVPPGVIRLEHVQNTWRLTPLPGDEVRIELWATADPGGLVPAMLFNFNLAEDSQQSLRQLRRMLQRSKYQHAVSVKAP